MKKEEEEIKQYLSNISGFDSKIKIVDKLKANKKNKLESEAWEKTDWPQRSKSEPKKQIVRCLYGDRFY